MILKLAWRNIWRNKRRTLITAASILFAVLFASFMESLQKGAWNNMINNVVNYYYGYLQVQGKDYWEEKTLDEAFVWGTELENISTTIPEIKTIVPRLESFALASTGEKTKGVMVIGVDPEKEDAMTNISEKVVQGAYFTSEQGGALIGIGLAKSLQLEIGDTIILIGQGYRGANAAGKYPIRGHLDFPAPEMDKQMMYLTLPEAQWFFAAEGLATSAAVRLHQPNQYPQVKKALLSQLDTAAYTVMDWKEMLPELLEAKALDSAGNIIVYIILYMIIAFGIFGTILMMTKEREYEFGILKAIGMRPGKLATTVWLETVLLALIGAFAGILVSIPIVAYFNINPIRLQGDMESTMEQFGFEPVFPAELSAQIFLLQALVVFLITAVLALYAIYKIYRTKPVEAMRS